MILPPLDPHGHGLLEVGGEHHLYWEECGNPSGISVVVLHGGPGSGCTPGLRHLFDPDAYRIILFDQRGAGRSRPRVTAFTDLTDNTTAHLLDDMERLREALGVERWVVYGLSWGVTLALAHAPQHPDHVIGLILSSVTMTRPGDIHWLHHEAGRFYPGPWRRFRAGVPERDRGGDLVAAYHRLLHEQPDLAIREGAARDWCAWEDAASPLPDGTPNPRYADPAFTMTFARIVTHYFHHRAWLDEGQLLGNAGLLSGLPGVLIHGRFDTGGPLDGAWELAQTWDGAELVLVDTGHTGGGAMTEAVLAAGAQFAARR